MQFFVRVAGRQNRHGGLVHRRPAHAGVQIARREGRRRHAADTGPTIEAVQELARAALILGHQPAREVERATGNVRVDVHAAGHHDHARRVDHAGARREIGVGDDAAIGDAQIFDDAVDAVRRIVDRATGDAKRVHRVIA